MFGVPRSRPRSFNAIGAMGRHPVCCPNHAATRESCNLPPQAGGMPVPMIRIRIQTHTQVLLQCNFMAICVVCCYETHQRDGQEVRLAVPNTPKHQTRANDLLAYVVVAVAVVVQPYYGVERKEGRKEEKKGNASYRSECDWPPHQGGWNGRLLAGPCLAAVVWAEFLLGTAHCT